MPVIAYEQWLVDVREALNSINMSLEDWQSIWPFDFRSEYDSGTRPGDAAAKANRHWWLQQNKSLKQECIRNAQCWLPRAHPGECQLVS